MPPATTLTPQRSGREEPATAGSPRARRLSLPVLALVVLAVGTLVGFVVYPTFPNYDSYYSLLWGREVLHGVKPSFDGYQTPTEHPLAIAFSMVLEVVGGPSDRIMVFATLASFVALAAGMYRLGRAAFTPLVGLAAAALLVSRFDFPFLAARGYIDIPYLAFVIWAAALEAERPRRGLPVSILLALACLMRPEAWLIAGLYFLWIAWPAGWSDRITFAVLAGIGPVIWVGVDEAVTGQPLFSLHHTSGLAEELGRQDSLSHLPNATIHFLENLDKTPVAYAGAVGALLALYFVPRRAAMPLVLLLIGMGTFVLVGLAGLSVIDRYLLVPSLMVMIFAALVLVGWTMVEPGRLRTGWIAGAGVLVAYGVLFTVTHVNVTSLQNQLLYRGEAHAALKRIAALPAVKAGERCGPVSLPNHKLVPDTRWVTDLGASRVVARSDRATPAKAALLAREERSGVAIYVTDRVAILRQALVDDTDDPLDSVPLPGYRFVGNEGYYGAYVKC